MELGNSVYHPVKNLTYNLIACPVSNLTKELVGKSSVLLVYSPVKDFVDNSVSRTKFQISNKTRK